MEDNICEICGKTSSKLYTISLEQSIMKVCSNCKSLGKEVKEIKTKNEPKNRRKVSEKEIVEDIIEGYGNIIKEAILGKYSSIDSFCKKYNISKHYLMEIIREDLKPTIEEAKKFERWLSIKLVIKEEIETPEIEKQEPKEEGITLEHFIKDDRLKKMLKKE